MSPRWNDLVVGLGRPHEASIITMRNAAVIVFILR
jgi:hypothetical protein